MSGAATGLHAGLRRRQMVSLAAAWTVWPSKAPAANLPPPTGWVLPRLPAPPIGITGADRRQRMLPALLAGKVSAVQLVFTGCNTSCSLQGALFAALAGRIRAADAQLLSVSIDALGDNADTLAAWQSRFGRHPAWLAAVPKIADVDRVAEFLKGASATPGTHTAQVFVFDRRSQLCFRTGDSPTARNLELLLHHVATLG